MIRKMRRRCCLILALLALACYVHAQSFKFGAALDSIQATGFYKIAVTPQLSAYARADNADIRIAGPDGNHVPYIVRTREPQRAVVDKVSGMKILGTQTNDTNTAITLEQENGSATFGISLTMATTAVERYAQISGSNDNSRWYIIDDNVMLRRADGYSKGSYSQIINFPGSRYKYYKLKIYNAHTDPLNITGAQAIHDSVQSDIAPTALKNPAPSVAQKDSNNHISYIVIRNEMPFIVNEVALNVAGPRFYERNARIYIMSTDKDSSALSYPVSNVAISSTHPATFAVPAQKAQIVLIEIENEDDPPLKISGATTQQQSQYLVAWLEQGLRYKLLVGDDQIAAPKYDLNRFDDSISTQLPSVTYGSFTANPSTAEPVPAKKGTSGNWLWAVIVVSVIVLGLLTYRLMRDVQKGSNS